MIVLSSMWERIQSSLFPYLEEELGELTTKQEKLVSILEIIRIEKSNECSPAQGSRYHLMNYPFDSPLLNREGPISNACI